MTATDETQLREAVRDVLKDVLKDVLTEVLSTSMRPAVIQSDSGISSVTREKMSNGSTKITAHVYHEDPDMADILCARLYERAMNYADNHTPGAEYPPYPISRD